jgi:sugar lactone lactonase YvrE
MYAVVYNTTDGDLELSKTQQNTYDISTASFSQSFSVNTEDGLPRGMAFNNDGTKMYMVGSATDNVYQYTLTTGFDVSTASYDSVSLNVGPQDTEPQGIAWNNDGTKLYLVGRTGSDLNEYTLTTAFDISTATYNDRFALSGIETTPTDMAWNNDGTKAFVIGETGDMVYEFSVSTAYDITSLTYVRGQSVSAKDIEPFGMAFNSDGTKFYFIGSQNDSIHEYDLGSAFNLTSMTFNQSFSVTSKDTNPQCLRFNSDGSKMYVIGTSSDSVHEYNIGTTSIPTGYHAVHTTTSTNSTYWTDINSMTADEAAGDGSIFYCVSTDDRSTWKIAHNTDGIRSIVRNNSGTWQYNSNGTYASTTWTNATTNTELNALQEAMTGATSVNGYQISVASYDSVSFSVSSQELAPRSIDFNSDGTKLFMTGNGTNAVYEYSLSTAYDISTMSYSSTSFSVSGQSLSGYSLKFKSDGTKMYVGDADNKKVFQYSLSTAFDLSTASYDSVNFNTGTQVTASFGFTGLLFSPDGTKMYAANNVGNSTSAVFQYTLSTAWDVSTASYASKSLTVGGQVPNPYDMQFNSDGTKFFITGNGNDKVHQYSLSTAYDISTGTSDSVEFSFASQEANPYALLFNSDGTKMYTLGASNDTIYQYSTSTTSYTNQMNKTQLDAVSDANHFTLANDLDLGIIFNLSSGTTVPSSDGVSINYDANVLNKGAILGTDYDFDAPAATKVRITALAANNLKVRVV